MCCKDFLFQFEMIGGGGSLNGFMPEAFGCFCPPGYIPFDSIFSVLGLNIFFG